MKKAITLVGALLLSLSLVGCSSSTNSVPSPSEKEQSKEATPSAKEQVSRVVEQFGKRLQMVSLLAPKEELKKNMLEQYGGLVAKPLLEKWMNDPQNAPGRQTSSPWPDRIDILSVEKISDTSYGVKGEIIEITSEEVEHGGVAAKRPIDLIVEQVGADWLITGVTLGEYVVDGVQYQNKEYGFELSLPEGWKGYTTVTEKWEGTPVESGGSVESGPMLLIRHPAWTKENPRQDIPIMVFNHKQWDEMQKDKFHIGAAPINPKELGRNEDYIFALPARYNFAFLTGYEEVEKILESGAFKALNRR